MAQASHHDPLRDLQAQVSELHRAVARQRALMLGLGFCVCGALAWQFLAGSTAPRAFAQDKATEITCRTLKVVDDAGKLRVQIAYDKHGGMLRIHNAAGKPVATLEADADGGFLSVLGHDSKERAFVGVGDQMSGGLIYLKDTDGKTRTTYLVYKDGNAGINFRNAQDKTEAFFGASGKGYGGLVNLNGPDGKTRVILDSDKDGRGALELLNGDDKTEIFLGSSAKGWGGLLNINAPNGTAGLILDIDDKGLGRMNLRTKEGKRIAFAGGDEEGGTFQVYGHDGKQRVFLGVGDKQTGGVLYVLNPDNNKARVAIGVDNGGIGYAEGRDANGVTKRAMR
jgi:hypothetical protein